MANGTAGGAGRGPAARGDAAAQAGAVREGRPRPARLARCLRTLAARHAVLLIAAAAALATMAAVPPDATYLGYLDLRTIGCLFGILAVVAALRRLGVFERAARLVVDRFSNCRGAVAALVGATLLLSMVATNDMALIMMLPLAAATLLEAGWGRALPVAFVLQNLAANLGGMILPFGNPQNLYLYERFAIPLGDFLAVMALPFAVSVALIAACCAVLVPTRPGKGSEEAKGASNAPDGALATAAPGASGSAPAAVPASTPVPAGVPRRGPSRRVRAAVCLGLLALMVAAVLRAVPWPAAVAAVAVALAVLDRRALARVDYGLLLTFVCFFVFAGNMARIPAVVEALAPLMADHGLAVSAVASQVISNVPTAVLLSHFTGDWAPLLVGVNVGGAGTLVASLAGLITFSHYRSVCALFSRSPRAGVPGPAVFLAWFTVLGFAFLAVLLAVCLGAAGWAG